MPPTMQVKLTPITSPDSPMTFELENGGSLTLGGGESQAELSWDLLESNLSLLFRNADFSLYIEPQSESQFLVNNEPMPKPYRAQNKDQLKLGQLECQVEIEFADSVQDPSIASSSLSSEGVNEDQGSDNTALTTGSDQLTTSKPQKRDDQPFDPLASPASEDDIFEPLSESAQKFESSFNATSSISIDTSRWLFKVLTGPNAGAQMGLNEAKSYTIGSDTHCDIVLSDLSVSKQHLKLTVFSSGEIQIEDLKSRNGVLINGEKIEDKASHTSSAIITAGATTFMIVDRTSEQKTIVTPALAVKERAVMEKVVENSAQAAQQSFGDVQTKKKETAQGMPAKKRYTLLAACAVAALGIALGMFSLFNTKLIVNQVQPSQVHEIAAILEEYPYFDYNFNQATATLTLNGHILTEKDKRQLLSKLAQITAIQRIDATNLVVDEMVWQQFNMAIEKNFKGISLSASAPGSFVLNGSLDTASQADNLTRYLRLNFPYNDHLQNKVIVFDQLLASINEKLYAIAPGELVAELNQGELILIGTVPATKSADIQHLVEQLKSTPGIRSVRNLIVEQSASDEAGIMDISQNYQVTGFSKASDANSSVMIKGRILRRGDQLDGMTVTSIRARAIILERDGVKYKINYNP